MNFSSQNFGMKYSEKSIKAKVFFCFSWKGRKQKDLCIEVTAINCMSKIPFKACPGKPQPPGFPQRP